MFVHEITNKKSIKENDEWYTPSYAIYPLLPYLNPNSLIWCPFDKKESNYVSVLEKAGHNIIYSHIDSGEDFFEVPIPKVDYIISNPPYSLRTQILKRLFEIDIPFAMLLGVVGIFESKKRFEMFSNNKFEIMYFDKRISFFRSYDDEKPSVNPPFSTAYICHNILPQQIVFEKLDKGGRK